MRHWDGFYDQLAWSQGPPIFLAKPRTSSRSSTSQLLSSTRVGGGAAAEKPDAMGRRSAARTAAVGIKGRAGASGASSGTPRRTSRFAQVAGSQVTSGRDTTGAAGMSSAGQEFTADSRGCPANQSCSQRSISSARSRRPATVGHALVSHRRVGPHLVDQRRHCRSSARRPAIQSWAEARLDVRDRREWPRFAPPMSVYRKISDDVTPCLLNPW